MAITRKNAALTLVFVYHPSCHVTLQECIEQHKKVVLSRGIQPHSEGSQNNDVIGLIAKSWSYGKNSCVRHGYLNPTPLTRPHSNDKCASPSTGKDQDFFCTMYLVRLYAWNRHGTHSHTPYHGQSRYGDFGKRKLPMVQSNESYGNDVSSSIL